ncbi:MAG: prephenate dehydrogenase/arogenate dehydrogenase family protein, partial [Clostridia bacterium]|nr:prephenate dehydrogenase/arogenate dehydrogenase family protein [Clostridia bacterium]
IVQKCSDFVDFDLIENADVLIFALYPHTFIDWIKENGSHIKEGAIITDVTGVKGCIVEKVQSLLPKGVEFISAHPMAGREVYGVENSDERMFFGANYIVVPTEKNTENGIECCKRIAEILGFG